MVNSYQPKIPWWEEKSKRQQAASVYLHIEFSRRFSCCRRTHALAYMNVQSVLVIGSFTPHSAAEFIKKQRKYTANTLWPIRICLLDWDFFYYYYQKGGNTRLNTTTLVKKSPLKKKIIKKASSFPLSLGLVKFHEEGPPSCAQAWRITAMYV